MSRDTRDDDLARPDEPTRSNPETRHSVDREPDRTRDRWSAARGLTLPRSPERRPVALNRERFRIRDSESELLATVGAFRVIAVRDLEPSAANTANPDRSFVDGDVRSLREQGLLQTHQVIMNGRSERVAVLTPKGRQLLEHARSPVDRPSEQRYYADLVKPRELAHDAQLYRMFETERERLEAEGATVARVVLDYELKADYHRYVHEQHLAGVDETHARRAFADAHDLPFAGGRMHFPDVRIEYETADGRTEYRDLELATEHYTRSQLTGKTGAGFRVYRAAGAGGRRGGTPSDPHHLRSIV